MANGTPDSLTPAGSPTSTLAQILRQDLSPQYQGFQLPRYTQPNLDILNQLASSGASQLPQVSSQLGFEPTAQWATQQFQEKTIPSIFGSFNRAGGPRAGYGSALPMALGRATRDFGLGLASQRGQFELAKHGALLKQLELGLRPQYETAIAPISPTPPSGLEQFKQQLGGAAGEAAGQLGVQAVSALGEKAWDYLTTAPDVPQEAKAGTQLVADAAKNKSWWKLTKDNISAWAPGIVAIGSKLGPAGFAALGIPLAIAAAGFAYFSREGK